MAATAVTAVAAAAAERIRKSSGTPLEESGARAWTTEAIPERDLSSMSVVGAKVRLPGSDIGGCIWLECW